MGTVLVQVNVKPKRLGNGYNQGMPKKFNIYFITSKNIFYLQTQDNKMNVQKHGEKNKERNM